ncbi:MAG: RNA 2',3'-cyclic phosphodiesterase, partial [Alphaproteobacteria bacterium]
MMRLFVGIELPETVRRSLGLLRGGIRGAKWQRDDQFHLTLRFIGEVPPSHLEEIVRALAGIGFSPFDLRLAGVGLFGNERQPRLLWAGVEEPEPLRHLARKVNQALERIGIA